MEIDLPDSLGSTKLPARAALTLYLIKAELKNTCLTNQLEKIGFDPGLSPLDFATLILDLSGFESRPDDVFDWYQEALEKYCSRLDDPGDGEKLAAVAFEFYGEIQQEQRRRYPKTQ
ncbi:MAG TPA: hypothetical protein VEB86_01100 [Chryseosolibacter sp.]|nr:hypothetical protein [Chryseosolibacter sp.]